MTNGIALSSSYDSITHAVKSLKHEVQPPHDWLVNHDDKRWSEQKLPSHHSTAAVNCNLSICIDTILTDLLCHVGKPSNS